MGICATTLNKHKYETLTIIPQGRPSKRHMPNPPDNDTILHGRASKRHKPIPPDHEKPFTTRAFEFHIGSTDTDPSLTAPTINKAVSEWTTLEVHDFIQKSEDWEKLGLPGVPQQFFDQDVNG